MEGRGPVLREPDRVNLAGQETGRDHISHSKLSRFLACARKFELHDLERLSPITTPRPLTLGKAFQKAIELQNPEAGPLLLDGWVILGPDAWLAPEEPIRFFSQDAENWHRVDQEIVRAAAKLYLARWPEGPGETREMEYRVRLRNPWTGHWSHTFDLLGFADGVIDSAWDVHDSVNAEQRAPQRPLELIENKLVGSVSAIKVQRLPLDRQIALSRYALWRITGRHVSRVHYRWIKKPQIRLRKNESIDEFLERIAGEYETRPDFYLHEEQPMWTGTADLLRVECELWRWAEELRHARHDGFYARNTSACTEFGGCAFIPVCSGDPDARALFERRPDRVAA